MRGARGRGDRRVLRTRRGAWPFASGAGHVGWTPAQDPRSRGSDLRGRDGTRRSDREELMTTGQSRSAKEHEPTMTTTTPTKTEDPKPTPGLGSSFVARMKGLGGPVVGLIVMIVLL